MKSLFARWTLALALLAAIPASAEIEVKVVEHAPPADVADAIKATLQSKSIQLLDDGEPIYDFWFVKEIALKGAPASPKDALEQVKEIALLGVAVSHVEQYDYRDDVIPAGAYTMRFGLQPNDGNHLGTAEFNYFAILIPAAHDTAVEGFPDHDDMVDESAGATQAEHPRILSLRPAEEPDAAEPVLHEPIADNLSVGVQVPGSGDVTVSFELIYEGHGEL